MCLHSIPHCLSSLSCDASVTRDMKWERSWMPDGREWSGTDHLCLGASPGKPLKRRSSLQPRCVAVWFLKGLTSLFVPPALELLIKKSMAFVMAGLFGGSSWTHVLAPDCFFWRMEWQCGALMHLHPSNVDVKPKWYAVRRRYSIRQHDVM